MAVLVGKDSDGIILEDDSMERNIRGKTCTLGPGGDDGADGHQGAPRAKRARTAAPAPHDAAEDEEGVRRKAKRAAAAAPAAAASGSSLRAVEVSDDDLAVLGVQRIPGGSSGGAGGGYQDDDDHDVDGEESENERSLNASPGVAEAIRSSAGKTLKLTGSGGANGKTRKQKRQVSGGGGGGDDLLRFRRPRAVLAELQGCKASTCSGDSAANANDDSPPAGKNPFDGVSDEILLHVFRWLSRHVLSRAAQSCRRFRRIAADELFWRKMDLGSKCVVPSGVVGLVAARGAQVIRAPRVSLASPVMRGLLPLASSAEAAAKGFKLSVVDLSGAAIQPKDLEEVLFENLGFFYLTFLHILIFPPALATVQLQQPAQDLAGEPGVDRQVPERGSGLQPASGGPAPGHGSRGDLHRPAQGAGILQVNPEGAERCLDRPVSGHGDRPHPGGSPASWFGEAEPVGLQGDSGGRPHHRPHSAV